jgi:hypothetical protein
MKSYESQYFKVVATMNKFDVNKCCSSIIDYMWKDEMKHYVENIHRYTEHLSEHQVDVLRDALIRFNPFTFDGASENQINSLMLPSGEHILEDVFQLARYKKQELLDAPLFDEMSCSEENSLQNESDYQDGLIRKRTASEFLEEVSKEVDMSKVLEAFETPVNDEPKKYDVKHFTQLNKIIGGEE